jgi:hypothetical protein
MASTPRLILHTQVLLMMTARGTIYHRANIASMLEFSLLVTTL